ncbi:hypothetical protein [Serinicoccus chungangensis]|uniref:hypothetical protein n=1 Tax=Serinicoccus chungangensis TaxID=767452 RepID=UPI001117F149|nr:hypothetical protein [Serinicoccus chungangensis]
MATETSTDPLNPIPPKALLELRTLVILMAGVVVGVVTGVLLWYADHQLAQAVLGGLGSLAITIKGLDSLVHRSAIT